MKKIHLHAVCLKLQKWPSFFQKKKLRASKTVQQQVDPRATPWIGPHAQSPDRHHVFHVVHYTLHFLRVSMSKIKEKSMKSHIQARLNEEYQPKKQIGS